MIDICIKKIGGVWFGVAHDRELIYATTFAFGEDKVLKSLRESLPSHAPFQQLGKPSSFAERVIAVIKDIYVGKNVLHSFSFATERLSKYARKVIDVVSLIPPGYVASYGAVAKAAGGSPRAVGRVMAINPFAPICACHRVVSSDLSLGGYGGGLDVKLAFLKREKRGYTSKKEIPVDGKKLELYPVEWVLRKLDKDKRQTPLRG